MNKKFFSIVLVTILVIVGQFAPAKANNQLIVEFDYVLGGAELVEQYWNYTDFKAAKEFAETHYYELTSAEQQEVTLVWNDSECSLQFTAYWPNGHMITVSVFYQNCFYSIPENS